MSDTPQGPGWWHANDGRWYPPEQHPNFEAPAPPSPEVLASHGWTTTPDGALASADNEPEKPWLSKRSNILGLALVAVVVVLMGVGAWAYFGDNDSKGDLIAQAGTSTTATTTTSDPCPPDELMSDSGCIPIETTTTGAPTTTATTTTVPPTTATPTTAPPVTMPSGQLVFPGYPKLVPIGSVDRRVASWYEGDAATGELVALAPGVYTPYNPNVPDLTFYLDLPNSGDCAMRELHFPNSGGSCWSGVS
jgi:hypothetical protein